MNKTLIQEFLGNISYDIASANEKLCKNKEKIMEMNKKINEKFEKNLNCTNNFKENFEDATRGLKINLDKPGVLHLIPMLAYSCWSVTVL